MDFVVGLPHSSHGHDMIWVIVDRLTKSALFLATRARDLSRPDSQSGMGQLPR